MLDNIGPATDNDPRMLTSDRIQIDDGLRVCDYDLKLGKVDLVASRIDSEFWDGWFIIQRDGGGHSYMNGERLSTRNPATGKSA